MAVLAVGCDHGGFPLKLSIVDYLQANAHDVIDLGTYTSEPVDYPDYAASVCQAILSGRAKLGVLICGSGVGVTVAANKFPGIRACMCHDSFSARQAREDDNTNVLCLGARVVGVQLAVDLVRIWLSSSFSGADRHVRRLRKVADIEAAVIAGRSYPMSANLGEPDDP